jgi:hypothetical protein
MCKKILASILSDKERVSKGKSKDPESVSNGQGHTEVALIYTEVLQLQVCTFVLFRETSSSSKGYIFLLTHYFCECLYHILMKCDVICCSLCYYRDDHKKPW